ncbi:MAG: hypothetical protein WAV21_03285 [Minisyncoccia bacterium]
MLKVSKGELVFIIAAVLIIVAMIFFGKDFSEMTDRLIAGSQEVRARSEAHEPVDSRLIRNLKPLPEKPPEAMVAVVPNE